MRSDQRLEAAMRVPVIQMGLTEEQKAKMLAGTREAASAFLEDMAYIRQIVAKEVVPRDELRRLSGLLRRFLVDRDLAIIAARD